MLSQDEIPVSNASAQTRQTGGILTPLSDNSLNLSDGGLHGGKKRKRDGNTMEDLLKDPFVVKVSDIQHLLQRLRANLRVALPLHHLCQTSNAASTCSPTTLPLTTILT